MREITVQAANHHRQVKVQHLISTDEEQSTATEYHILR